MGDTRDVLTIDRLVDHTSTVPAILGQHVGLFVRERVLESALDGSGKAKPQSVVLFIHGGYSPSALAFDTPLKDYSWMEYLARDGYDVFGMDITGYGRSTRPMMDDPRNLDSKQQDLLIPRFLAERSAPTYPFELLSSDTETADIDAVVEFIRKLRGVDKITLIGWSGGGIRTGTYVVRHPGKVSKLIILASSNYSRANPDDPPPKLPKAGVPMTLETYDVGINQRWLALVKGEDQVEPGMPEFIRNQKVGHDPLAATWEPGALRAPTRTYWGWNATSAKKITVPTLMMAGDQDSLLKSNLELFDDLGSKKKVFLRLANATHFVVWEKQRRVVHRASLDWLNRTALEGKEDGMYQADQDGRIAPAK